MLQPRSGRRSNQASRSPSSATAPIASVSGGRSPARSTAAGNSSSGAKTLRWRGVEARSTAAAGVFAGRLPSISWRRIAGSARPPISTMIVPPARAIAPQSIGAASFSASAPATTVKLDA